MLYVADIKATDLGKPVSLDTRKNLTINVKPVNEYAPQFTYSTLPATKIKENMNVGNGLVLADVNATDKDYGRQGNRHYVLLLFMSITIYCQGFFLITKLITNFTSDE